MERERTFLVADMPELPDAGTRIRQGYLAIDGEVQVRIREREGDGRTLTVKGGRGAVRTEVELVIGVERFEALWPLTAGRRIDKTRYVVPVDGAAAEVDVFAGDLTGLVLVEVELESDEAMAAPSRSTSRPCGASPASSADTTSALPIVVMMACAPPISASALAASCWFASM